jgi:hypothetical protein
MAALNAEVTRQAGMVAYIDDFKLIMLIALASIPLLLLLREGRREPPPIATAAAMTSLGYPGGTSSPTSRSGRPTGGRHRLPRHGIKC